MPFRPFVQLPKRGPSTWAISDQGKRWIIDNMKVYRDIRGPQGVDEAESSSSKKKKKLDWKQHLASAYIANWPQFDWEEVVGKDASQSMLDVAQRVGPQLMADSILMTLL